MGEWLVQRVGDLVQQRKDIVVLEQGVEYRTMGVRWYGKGAYDRGAATTETIKAKRLWRAHAGDFVFNRIDTQNGAFDVVPSALDGALVTNEFPTYTGLPGVLDERFLLAYFQQQSVQDAIGVARAGSEGRARWKEADFEEWVVALPPLDEQRRIVAVMSAVDAQIESLTSEQLTASAARVAFEVGACATLESLPVVALGEIADVVGGVTKDKRKEAADANIEVPYLRVANVQRGYLDLASVTSIRVAPKTLKARALQDGDLLLNEGGDRDKLGRGWVWEGQIPTCIHQNHVHRARVGDQDAYLPKFVSTWANTFGPDWFFDNGGQTNGIASISISKVRQFPVPRASITQQRELVAVSDALRRVGGCLAAELAALRIVRADLLSALMSHEIEVDAVVDAFVTAA